MVRAVVHKTKGKFDLRSLIVFGLNAKPDTDTPIGYFGTGLKYAVAVLARNNIPITFWIDGKKWTIEQDDTKFRNKSFRALSLKRNTLIPKVINLPFTTELGKNWDIWQAFRELESNTRDEHGTTELHVDGDVGSYIAGGAGFNKIRDTWIVVVDTRYVECFLNKDQYFLPDGLTQQEPGSMSDRIQVFARKSKAVYYRSIRILELKEPGENTYNILSQIQLTEDRTAKSEFDVKWEIQNYLTGSENKEVVRRAVSAPPRTFERKFDYEYSSCSEVFLDEVANAGEDATDCAKSVLKRDRPPKPSKVREQNWIRCLIDAIDTGDWDEVEALGRENRENLVQILILAACEMEKEDANNSQGRYSGDVIQTEAIWKEEHLIAGDKADLSQNEPSTKAATENDDIPF